jgi:hypothetical protein
MARSDGGAGTVKLGQKGTAEDINDVGKPQPTKSNRRRGYVLMTMAPGATMLFGSIGLAVDVGYLQWTRRGVQTGGRERHAAGGTRAVSPP